MTETEAKAAVVDAAEKFASALDAGGLLPEGSAAADLVQAACEKTSLGIYLAVQRLREARTTKATEATP
jgi:hypothetical protein